MFDSGTPVEYAVVNRKLNGTLGSPNANAYKSGRVGPPPSTTVVPTVPGGASAGIKVVDGVPVIDAVIDEVFVAVGEPVAVNVCDEVIAGEPDKDDVMDETGLPETDDVAVIAGLLDTDELTERAGVPDTDELRLAAGLPDTDDDNVDAGLPETDELTV